MIRSTLFPRLNIGQIGLRSINYNRVLFRAYSGVKSSFDDAISSNKATLEKEKSSIAKDKKRLNALKAKLRKEKEAMSKTKKQLGEALKKQKQLIKERSSKEKLKEAKAAAKEKKKSLLNENKEKKFLEKALKPYRKLSAYTIFVKENTNGTTGIEDVAKMWNSLSETEKESYKGKADDYNEEMLKVFVPKPKAPPSSYALFVKENFPTGPQEFKEVTKELSARWKALSESDKKSYEPSDSAKEHYKKIFDEWKQSRIKAYKDQQTKA